MSLLRYFLNIEDGVPCVKIAVLERGAIVNATQNAVNTVNVHAPHEIAASDKFIFCPSRTNVVSPPGSARVFSVDSVTATSVTFSGSAFSFPDLALLLNAGADTGGGTNSDGTTQKLNWDAVAVAVYKDAAGTNAWTNSLVDVTPGNEVGFWGNGRITWIAAIDGGDRAVRVYPDVGASGASHIVRSTTDPAPGDGTPMLWVEAAGAPGGGDRLKVWMTDGAAWAWWDIIDAEQ
jgi:hypothetical protein